MSNLVSEFTSTGSKLFWHQEAMQKLRDGKGMPIVSHLLITDRCQARCSFCSVGERPGDTLPFSSIVGYLEQLLPLGLKAVIISGGGNPILYRDGDNDFNTVIDYLKSVGLEVGLITNGMPMKEYPDGRTSWKTVKPETLDKLTWIRISMAGLDHPEKEVYVPDIDQSKTTLGFSWIMSDSYEEPSHKHGWVSTPEDIKTPMENRRVEYAVDRLPWIEEQIRHYVEKHKPAYTRLLCNCLEPAKIPERHAMLQAMAERIDKDRIFSQFKPPRQPRNCYKGYGHPVLNCDGWVFSCDSTVLQVAAGHKFADKWRVCRWDKIGEFYANPIKPTVAHGICPQCVFNDQVDMLAAIVEDKMETPFPTGPMPEHVNFI